MLLQFSFGNYRSFRDRVTLDMTAVPRLHKNADLDAGNVVQTERNGGVLRVAAIYGANASGKSNVVKALASFQEVVATSADHDFNLWLSPFMLDEKSLYTSNFFEVVFLHESVQYRYGFESKKEEGGFQIISEWLYDAQSSKESLLFERENDAVSYSRRFSEAKTVLDANRVLRRKEPLLLSLLAQNGLPVSQRIVHFLTQSITVVSGLDDTSLRNFTVESLKNKRFTTQIKQLMQVADKGIDSLLILDNSEPFDKSATFGETMARRVAQTTDKEEFIQVSHGVYNANGKKMGLAGFPMDWMESEGTKKLFAFTAPILDTLENGNVLFVDEMDARFHPNLTREIVRLFQSEKTNPKNAQLIFVTHDTNLLDPKRNRFRRDQIWFVEKDRLGVSRLYSLVEFKGVRHTSEDEYISGTYGAIPFLSGMEKLITEGFSADVS